MSTIDANAEIGLVRLTVRDLGRARAFYEEGLGLRVADASAGVARLSAADGPPLLELRSDRVAAPVDRSAPGLYHVALLLPTRRDLAVALFRLSQSSLRLTGASDHLVSESLYLDDPEGNGIELYRDRPRSTWPHDAQGRLTMSTLPLDLASLADELAGEAPPPEPLTRLPAGTRTGHVHLQVSELRRSEAFYCGVLGFDVTVRDSAGALFLAAGGYHHHVGLNVWRSQGAAAARPGVGLRSFELRLPTNAAFADVIDRVVADELPFEHVDGGTLLRDPSGNAVLLTG
jgi:catechol 2,3-dioxygenase